VIVYSHTISPRLQYVLHFLSRYYGQAIQVTADEAVYHTAPDTCKIWYSSQPVSKAEICIEPCSLLFEKGVKPISIECFDYNGSKAFFRTGGTLPFDLFAAVFFLLSRYEEYLPHQKDAYGRYAHENAMAYQHNFLKNPLINSWLEDFRTILIQKDASFNFHSSPFTFQPTYDIDVAWSYKAKGFKRTAGGFLKSIIAGRWQAARERMQVLQEKSSDPYDAYNWLDILHRQYSLKPLYFFLVAQQRNIYDKNPSPYNKLFQKLISYTAAHHGIGLHPSWQSGDDALLLQNEKTFLEKVAEQPITATRQHYIRLTLPQTYRQLISTGLTDDYSMGYGSINGFRASVATPFYWYDLEQEQETSLLLHPFCFMDANAYYEQRQSPEQTCEELLHYYNVVKSVHGNLCTIWHNHFLGTDKTFKGWRELYERFVALACS
jgi:hypothetical protein